MFDQDPKREPRPIAHETIEYLLPYLHRAILASPKEISSARALLAKSVASLMPATGELLTNIEAAAATTHPRAHWRAQNAAPTASSAASSETELAFGEDFLSAAVTVYLRDVFPTMPEESSELARRRLDELATQYGNLSELGDIHRLLDAAQGAGAERALQHCRAFDHDAAGANTMILRSLIAHAGTLVHDELRAEYVAHAARRACELIYRRYVEQIYYLWGASKGRDYGPPGNYGTTMRILTAESAVTIYPNLIEERAVHIRNSFAHDDWDYDVDTDRLLLRDDKKSAICMSVDEVLQLTRHLVLVAGVVLPGALRARVDRANADMAHRYESIWKCLISADAGERSAAITLLVEDIEQQRKRKSRGRNEK